MIVRALAAIALCSLTSCGRPAQQLPPVTVQDLGGAVPCSRPETCDAGYRTYLHSAPQRPGFELPPTPARFDAGVIRRIPLSESPGRTEIRQRLARGLAIGELASASASGPLTVRVVSEEPWPGGGRRLGLVFDDPAVGSYAAVLLLPEGAGPHPAVVVHPGHGESAGWQIDNRFGSSFPRHGLALLVIEPRLHAGDEAAGELTLALLERGHSLLGIRTHEILAAVRWVRARPDIDGRRVGVAGHSGGSLVATLALWLDDGLSAIVFDLSPSFWSYAPEEYASDESVPWLVELEDLVDDLAATGRPFMRAGYGYPDGGEAAVVAFFVEELGAAAVPVGEAFLRECLSPPGCTSAYLGAAERRREFGHGRRGGGLGAQLGWGPLHIPKSSAELDRTEGQSFRTYVSDQWVGRIPVRVFRSASNRARGTVVTYPAHGPEANWTADVTTKLRASGFSVVSIEPRAAEPAIQADIAARLAAIGAPLHGLRVHEVAATGWTVSRLEWSTGLYLLGDCYGADLVLAAGALGHGFDGVIARAGPGCEAGLDLGEEWGEAARTNVDRIATGPLTATEVVALIDRWADLTDAGRD